MALKKEHFLVIALIFVVDQISKFFVSSYLSESVELLPFLRLTLVKNAGIAFGLLNDFNLRWFFVGFSVAVVVFLFKYSKKEKCSVFLYSSALIIVGALGNAVDRVLFGSVVDFIDFGLWPAFNVADASLTIGVLGLLYHIIKSK